MGRILHSVIVVPVSTRIRGLSVEAEIGPEDGIDFDSAANLDNLQVIHRTRLVRRLGHARPSTMQAICRALAIATGCDREQ